VSGDDTDALVRIPEVRRERERGQPGPRSTFASPQSSVRGLDPSTKAQVASVESEREVSLRAAKGPRRILILSASAGAGHLRAAEAVEAACHAVHPAAEVRHADALTLTPRSFRRLYGQGYLDFVNRVPELLRILYDRTNRPPRNPAADSIRKALQQLNTRRFVRYVVEFAPDVIYHTHFLPADIDGKGQGRGNSGLFLASTGPGLPRRSNSRATASAPGSTWPRICSALR